MSKKLSKDEHERVMRSLYVGKVIDALKVNRGAKRATYYVSPAVTVKATRKSKQDGRARHSTYVVTEGTPNYLERRFIKLCKKAGEPFPVKKVQIKDWPVPRAKKNKKAK